MKQKTINQNKLLTILCIIALTLGVLVSAVLFSITPVHAEESVNGTEIFKYTNIATGSYTQTITYYISEPCEYYNFVLGDPVNSWRGGIVIVSPSSSVSIKSSWVTAFDNGNVSSSVLDDDCITYTLSNGLKINWYSLVPSYGVKHDVDGHYYLFNSGYDFSTKDGVKKFLEHYFVNKDLKADQEVNAPNTSDEAYTYTGFSINGKTARWTGTTERSYLKDQDVEEYTTITYAWATTTEPDNIGTFQEYNGEFPTSAKQLKLPWSDMESGKVDFQFIRQVNIIPCYRVPGAFYHGQAVKIFFKPNGTLDRIEQVTIPSDSETIGNDISLIGFRYDSSFHAEWVDVWSNGANKSAFDLAGSQYLSLGIKAVYYDGSKSDIDFFTLDRKNLVWDKTFSDFKENNGSPIKSLYFTPYAKTGVNNPWNKGNSTVVNFDEKGNPSSSFDTGDDGTVHLNDFKLTGVVWNKPVVQSGTITWTGTTPNSDLLFIPDSDTLVVATYPRYDSDMNSSIETWSTTTIGKGSMKVNVDYLIDYYQNSELAWNGEMWLTPCYKKGGVLYMGEPVIVNCLKGTVSDIVVDEDSGKAEQVDKTDQNKNDADSILNVGNQFYSIVNGLIGSLQQLPALLTAIFGFLPSSVTNLFYASFAVIIICRILGR